MARSYYTVSEFADITGRTTQTIYKQIQSGRLKPYSRKMNGVRKIHADALKLYQRPEDEDLHELKLVDPDQEPEQDSETVVLLKDQIRILNDALESERESHKHTREILKESQEMVKESQEMTKQAQELVRQAQDVMQQQIEAIKAQLITQHTLIISDQAENDQDPQPAADPKAPDKVQTRSQSSSQQQKAERPAEQAPERRGFWSRFFGRS